MISVIIPIFNSSEYISYCIESVLTQTYQDFEVLLVDDGSTDNTSSICKKYAEQDNRVKYFYKENSGVSATRNYGLNRASGKYIMFIDSDDFFCDNSLFEKCVKSAHDNLNSLIVFNCMLLKTDNTYVCNKPFNVKNSCSMIEIISCCIAPIKSTMNIFPLFRAVWGKLFDREIIEKYNIRFDGKMHHSEDEIFLISYIKYVTEIVDINLYGLVYRAHPGSLTRGYIKELMEQSLLKLNHIKALYGDIFDNISIKTSLYEFVWQMYFSIYLNEKNNKSKPQNKCKIWLKNNENILKSKINKKMLSKSTRVYNFVYLFFPIFIPFLNKMKYMYRCMKSRNLN